MAQNEKKRLAANIGDLFKCDEKFTARNIGCVFIVLKSNRSDPFWIRHWIYISYFDGTGGFTTWAQHSSSLSPIKLSESESE